MILGPLVSVKLKGSSMCISTKTEICHFVHNIIIITHNMWPNLGKPFQTAHQVKSN